MQFEFSSALLKYFIDLMEKDNSLDSKFFLPYVKEAYCQAVQKETDMVWSK